jgi:proline iminopeptidase
MEQLADDAVALADHLGLERLLVLGHSYGGFVAQELALRHGDRLDGLLLVSTTPGQLGTGESPDDEEPGPPPPPEMLARMGSLPTTDDEFAAGMADLLPFYFHRRPVAEVAQLMDGTVHSASAMARGFEVLASWSSVDRLRTITCPVLLVFGRHDLFTSWPQSNRIARRVDDADVVILEDSGHFPWIDEPDAFFAAVNGWLDAHR